MPELPEVETVRRGLMRHVIGRRIARVRVHETRLREPVDAARLESLATARRIACVERRAKYLLLRLDDGGALLLHLGMTGRLGLEPAAAPHGSHLHVVLSLDGGLELRFHDPRRFGLVAALAPDEVASDRRLVGLGVEPLSRQCTGAHLHALARGSRRAVKSFLMDAGRVVGVGNIYASESLFVAGVRPRRAAGRVTAAEWARLAAAMKRVLRAAIRQGGTTMRDFRALDGEGGYFQVRLHVYDRAGEPCLECRTPIRRLVLGGRSTFYCPRCQQ
jgi:formamidopyrimidine-DNA glycosylase